MIQSKSFHIIDYTSQAKLPEFIQNWIRSSKVQEGAYSRDYNSESYYLISLGSRPTSGYKVKIEKLEETEDEIEVYVKEVRPDPKGFYNPVITYPYLLATSEKPVKVNWLI